MLLRPFWEENRNNNTYIEFKHLFIIYNQTRQSIDADKFDSHPLDRHYRFPRFIL